LGCANQGNITKSSPEEDLYIMLALDSEKSSDYQNSFKFYNKLYTLTKKESYLKKAIEYSFRNEQFEQMLALSQIALKKYPQNKEYYWHQYIISLHSLKRTEEAIKESKQLIKEFQTSQSYELIGNIYYVSKDYTNALKYYESSYTLNQNQKTLIQLTNILYNYLNKKDVALAYLETYLQTKGCSAQICNKLMLIYQEQGNIDGMISILNRMYTKYKDEPELKKTTLYIQNLIISLLEKKDIKKAIKFLEDTGIDQAKLINLYYRDKQLSKALKLTKKLYKQSRKPELLGKIAMYRFELAQDKMKVMPNVIANFELALSSGINNASYQNYYGYLLIDFDIDVKKGVALVKEALKTAPNNIAYLDSLAWGYYKLQQCEEAYRIMSKVVVVAGVKDKEINKHWEKIKKCVKGK
jgi:tetratricopeptide (TPR) repeat protein